MKSEYRKRIQAKRLANKTRQKTPEEIGLLNELKPYYRDRINVNKILIQNYGLMLAGFIEILLSHMNYLIAIQEIKVGEMFYITQELEAQTALNYDQQKYLFDKLKDFFITDDEGKKIQLIDVKLKGLPKRRHIKINIDVLNKLVSEELIIHKHYCRIESQRQKVENSKPLPSEDDELVEIEL